jgi:hypothetical protein
MCSVDKEFQLGLNDELDHYMVLKQNHNVRGFVDWSDTLRRPLTHVNGTQWYKLFVPEPELPWSSSSETHALGRQLRAQHVVWYMPRSTRIYGYRTYYTCTLQSIGSVTDAEIQDLFHTNRGWDSNSCPRLLRIVRIHRSLPVAVKVPWSRQSK